MTKKLHKLPTFNAVTLDREQLGKLAGGRRPLGCGTAGTRSVCHVDGTDDGDSYSL